MFILSHALLHMLHEHSMAEFHDLLSTCRTFVTFLTIVASAMFTKTMSIVKCPFSISHIPSLLTLKLFWLWLSIAGMGLGLAYVQSSSLVPKYFDRLYPRASSIVTCGTCVAMVIFAPLTQVQHPKKCYVKIRFTHIVECFY